MKIYIYPNIILVFANKARDDTMEIITMLGEYLTVMIVGFLIIIAYNQGFLNIDHRRKL